MNTKSVQINVTKFYERVFSTCVLPVNRYTLINRNIRGNTLVPYSTDHPPRRTKVHDSKRLRLGGGVAGSLRACKRSILGHNDVKGLSDSLTVRRFDEKGCGVQDAALHRIGIPMVTEGACEHV